MKKTRTLVSLVLTLVLALSLSIPAMAAGGDITVMNTNNGNSYKAFKIFDASLSATGDVIYEIDANSEWKDVVYDAANDTSLITGLEFTPDDPAAPTKYTVTKTDGFRAADLANTLRAAYAADTTGFTATTGAWSYDPAAKTNSTTVSEDGYYLVLSSADGWATIDPKASLLTVLNGDINIQNKNDMPLDKEVEDANGNNIDEQGVAVGDTLTFTITSKVPTDISAYTEYFYFITDKMTAGLDFNPSSLSVKIGGTSVTANLGVVSNADTPLTGNEVRYEKNGYAFELSLDLIGETPDAIIEITYTATVTEAAVAKLLKNEAELQYGNDPTNLTIKNSETKNYVSQIVINKFETGAPEQKLSGAKFVLYRLDASNNPEYYFWNDVDKEVQWIAAADLKDSSNQAVTDPKDADNITIVETDLEGRAVFSGLDDGTYKLLEVEAPTGYALLAQAIDITVNGSAATTVGLDEHQIAQALTETASVSNTPSSIFPSTGGIGTTIFYVFGGALILFAGIFLVIKRRKEAQE